MQTLYVAWRQCNQKREGKTLCVAFGEAMQPKEERERGPWCVPLDDVVQVAVEEMQPEIGGSPWCVSLGDIEKPCVYCIGGHAT